MTCWKSDIKADTQLECRSLGCFVWLFLLLNVTHHKFPRQRHSRNVCHPLSGVQCCELTHRCYLTLFWVCWAAGGVYEAILSIHSHDTENIISSKQDLNVPALFPDLLSWMIISKEWTLLEIAAEFAKYRGHWFILKTNISPSKPLGFSGPF